MKTLDDFHPGDAFRHERACDRLRPVYYAAASGDFNPIHIDAEVARSVGFERNILQGMCTYAWLAEACAAYLGDPGRIRRLSARFARPVLPGDVVTFDGRCAAAEGDGVRLEVAVSNQRGEEVLASARVEASLAPFVSRLARDGRPPAPAPAGADPRVGRRYGPFRYEVGVEKVREFAVAVAGGVPARGFGAVPEQAGLWPAHGSVIAPPTFAAAYAIEPFAQAFLDPANGVDPLRVLHGEHDLAIHAAVHPGDVLETIGEIASVARKPRFDVFVIRARTVNQRREVVLDVDSAWIAR